MLTQHVALEHLNNIKEAMKNIKLTIVPKWAQFSEEKATDKTEKSPENTNPEEKK